MRSSSARFKIVASSNSTKTSPLITEAVSVLLRKPPPPVFVKSLGMCPESGLVRLSGISAPPQVRGSYANFRFQGEPTTACRILSKPRGRKRKKERPKLAPARQRRKSSKQLNPPNKPRGMPPHRESPRCHRMPDRNYPHLSRHHGHLHREPGNAASTGPPRPPTPDKPELKFQPTPQG